MYLIDANIIIDYLKRSTSKPHFIDTHNHLFISYIVAGELLQGVRNKKDLKLTQSLLDSLEVDYGSININRLSLQILESHYLKDEIGFLDALIAATAIERKATLVTLNLKHFMPIKNLKVITPK